MGKKKNADGTQMTSKTARTKRSRNTINLDLLRDHIKNGSNAKDIMNDMGISQVGSLRNAVFMLSQVDETFYTVPGLIDETRFKPILKVGKAGIRLPLEKLPFAKGTTVSYEITEDIDGNVTVSITGRGSVPEIEGSELQEQMSSE